MIPLDYLMTLAFALPQGTEVHELDNGGASLTAHRQWPGGGFVRVWFIDGAWGGVVSHAPDARDLPSSPTPPTLAYICRLLGEAPPPQLMPRPRRAVQLHLFDLSDPPSPTLL